MAQEITGMEFVVCICDQWLHSHACVYACTEFLEVCTALKLDMLEIMRSELEMPQEAIDWVDQVRRPLVLAMTAAVH